MTYMFTVIIMRDVESVKSSSGYISTKGIVIVIRLSCICSSGDTVLEIFGTTQIS